jgi:tetratricopeptide (TPR) repeat protein
MESDGSEGDRTAESAAEGAREARRREFAERMREVEAERDQAAAAGDGAAEAAALRKLGDVQRAAGLDDGAREAYSKARYLYQLNGNADGAASILVALGNMEARLRRFEAAARFFHEARDLFQRLVVPEQEADALLSEADALLSLERAPAAIQRIDAASAIFAKLDDTLGQAHAAFRLGMIAMVEDPQMADEHLELATRLFGDHVGREAPDKEVPLPATVPDSRRYPPFVMQRVCLRERQRLAGGGRVAPLKYRHVSASSVRKARRAVQATPEARSTTTWIGVGVLVILVLVFLLPQWLAGTNLVVFIADYLGDSVSLGTVVHLGVALFGAAVAIVAAQQLGISAPVVLLAMAIGFGMIFHEVSRVVFSGFDPPRPSIAMSPSTTPAVDAEAIQLGRANAAKLLLDARNALARGDIDAARAGFNESRALAESNLDPLGQVRALEELLALESEYGEMEDRLRAAGRLYDSLGAADILRRREVLEEIVALATQLGDQAALRDAHTNLLAHYESAGDAAGEVTALLALAALDRDAHQLERAYDWFSRAHSAYQSLRDGPGQIGTLLALGEIDARLGRRRRAYGRYYHAFAMYREIGDESGQAAMLLHMGNLDESGERYEEAIAAFRQSQRLYKSVGDPAGEALAALRFAAAQGTHGNQRQARDGFRRSLELYQLLGDDVGQARANLGLGQYWSKAGEWDVAAEHFDEAKTLYQQAKDPRGQLSALREIALLAHDRGTDTAAQGNLAEIRRVTRGIVDPGLRAGMLLSAGDLALTLQRREDAESTYREALALYQDIGDDPGQRAASERLSRIAAPG